MKILDYNKDTDSDWEEIARHNPYFGVLTHEKFLAKNLTPEALNDFFDSGKKDIIKLLEKWNNFDNKKLNAVLDFGSGTGRLLLPMAKYAKTAFGIEISESMTAEITKNAEHYKTDNIKVYKTVEDMIASNPTTKLDWINSRIVFQHIPPERGYEILDKLLGLLKINGYFSLHFNIFSTSSKQLNEAIYQQINSHTFSVLYAQSDTSLGTMQMYDYDINRIFYLLLKHGIIEFNCISEMHDEHQTLLISGQKTLYSALPLSINHNFLKDYLTFSQSIETSGLSVSEAWGTWTVSKEAIIAIILKQELYGKDLVLDLKLRAFLDKTGQQSFSVYANTEKIAEFTVNNPDDADYSIKIPKKITKQDNFLSIRFEIKQPTSPFDLGLSVDARKLGLGISYLSIRPEK